MLRRMLASRHIHRTRQVVLCPRRSTPPGVRARGARNAGSAPASGGASSGAIHPSVTEEELMTVASWRLALLQHPCNSYLTDFSSAMRLKGVSFGNRQALIQQLQAGQGVLFCREPSNPADPNAVGVYTACMQPLGYVPRRAAQDWQLQTCFGRILTIGQADGVGLWGATVECKLSIHGLCLDLLPDSWQAAADLQQVLGAQQWARVQQQVLEQYGHRCAVSSMPLPHEQQGKGQPPLRVIPQWRFDYNNKQVQLAELIPICEPLYQLQQQLAAAADQLAKLAPTLQLPVAADSVQSAAAQLEAAGGDNAAPDQQASAVSAADPAAAMHEAYAEAAASAVAALPAEQQQAVKWLGILTPWLQVDCVRYIAYAGWRRQQLLLQEGWQLVSPSAQQVAGVLPPLSSSAAAAAEIGLSQPAAA